MEIKELLRDLMHSGPENVRKLMSLLEKLPSDYTLQGLSTTVNNLIPYIPQLERMLGSGNISNLERIMNKIPDNRTLEKLANALPMLEKMPDQATLNKLLEKADSLKGFLDTLEGGK